MAGNGDLPRVGVIGAGSSGIAALKALVQPLRPVMPVAELQGRIVADYLTGPYALPDPDSVLAEIDRDRRRHLRRFPADSRHALEIDAESYKRELRREWRQGRRRAAR